MVVCISQLSLFCVRDQSTPKARSVMAFPSGESFATVDDGRTQPRPMRAFRDRVVGEPINGEI